MTDQSHDDENQLDRELARRLTELPRVMPPERDLWPAIAPRLSAPSRHPGAVARFLRPGLVLGLAAAAAALVWWGAAGHRPEVATPAIPASPAVSPADAEPVPSPAPDLVPGESEYRLAVDLLARSIEDRRDDFSPELLGVYDESVILVDAAIADSQAALARHPDDERLRRLLDDAYRQKLDLLEQIAAIPGRS